MHGLEIKHKTKENGFGSGRIIEAMSQDMASTVDIEEKYALQHEREMSMMKIICRIWRGNIVMVYLLMTFD